MSSRQKGMKRDDITAEQDKHLSNQQQEEKFRRSSTPPTLRQRMQRRKVGHKMYFSSPFKFITKLDQKWCKKLRLINTAAISLL